MARRLTILHTNDIHGRVEALARIATLVERARAETSDPVLYLDVGDAEDTTNRLSNLTKGVGIHRLLRVAGCDAVAVGNAVVLRYGAEPLVDQIAVSGYPHLAANLFHEGKPVAGAQPRALVDAGGIRVGLIGLSPTSFRDLYESFWGYELPDPAPLVREHAAALRSEGAEVVVLLSHLGLPDDRELAAELASDVDLVLGAHSHSLLPEGEVVEGLTLAHAGEYGEHLGRVELTVGDGVRVERVGVEAVTELTPMHPAVVVELKAAEQELEEFLGQIVGVLPEELDLAYDRDCRAVAFMAEVVRERMAADVGLATAGSSFVRPLAAGPLARGALWDACPSTANPGVTSMTGAQLQDLLRRGREPEFARETPHSLRGAARGLIHLSGAESLDPARIYCVAGSDVELHPAGGYALEEWGLEVTYDLPTIMREAVEEHLRGTQPREQQ